MKFHVIVYIIVISKMTFASCLVVTDDKSKISNPAPLNKELNFETDIAHAGTTTVKEHVRDTTFQIPDEKLITAALNNIAYFLRNHKFNEWDRRYHRNKPSIILTGYYKAFPKPSLRTLHWKVHENCKDNFYKCITYLHSVIETSPFTRADDVTIIMNVKPYSINGTTVKHLNNDCKTISLNAENSGLPFDDPLEKFQWRTTASYFMCWYTMLGTPALSMLGESCDNFANCLDPVFGARNHDPRADNRLSFSCALYSFCPDPCCSLKYVTNLNQCYENQNNPCFIENRNSSKKVCTIDRMENQDLNGISANKWNVTCNCEIKGFAWKSQFQMCVDVNECLSGSHNCNKDTEDCLNLPGTYQCICKWGFALDRVLRRCVKTNLFLTDLRAEKNKHIIFDHLMTLLNYVGI